MKQILNTLPSTCITTTHFLNSIPFLGPHPVVEAKLDCEATTISVSWKKPEEGTMTGYRVTCLTKEEVEKEKENKEKEGKEKKRIIRCLFYHVVFFIVDSKEGIHFFSPFTLHCILQLYQSYSLSG